jgi:hypothetical protein
MFIENDENYFKIAEECAEEILNKPMFERVKAVRECHNCKSYVNFELPIIARKSHLDDFAKLIKIYDEIAEQYLNERGVTHEIIMKKILEKCYQFGKRKEKGFNNE